MLIFIHPQGTAELENSGRLNGNGLLTNVIGNPLETTIALSHLIFEGTLDKFPGLKICAAHGGGYLPSYAARSDAVQLTFPKRMTGTLKKKPTEYVRQMYYDTIVFTPEALRHLAAEAGVDKIVMGTDYPFPWTSTSVDHILGTPGFSDADKIAMLGGTAMKLLGDQGAEAARSVGGPAVSWLWCACVDEARRSLVYIEPEATDHSRRGLPATFSAAG